MRVPTLSKAVYPSLLGSSSGNDAAAAAAAVAAAAAALPSVSYTKPFHARTVK